MHMLLRREQKDGFFVAELSINESHCELTVKVRVRPDATDLEIDFVISYEVCKQAIYHPNLYVFIL